MQQLARRYAQLLRRPRVRLIVLVVGIEGLLFFGAFSYVGAYLKFKYDLSYTAVGLVIAANAVGGVTYSLLVRKLLRCLGLRGLVTGGGILLLCCYSGLSLAPNWGWCVPLVMLSGFGFYMLHNTLQTQATEMAPEARGSAVSCFAFSMFLSQAIGVWLSGKLIEGLGYPALFIAAAVGLFVLALWFASRVETQAHDSRV